MSVEHLNRCVKLFTGEKTLLSIRATHPTNSRRTDPQETQKDVIVSIEKHTQIASKPHKLKHISSSEDEDDEGDSRLANANHTLALTKRKKRIMDSDDSDDDSDGNGAPQDIGNVLSSEMDVISTQNISELQKDTSLMAEKSQPDSTHNDHEHIFEGLTSHETNQNVDLQSQSQSQSQSQIWCDGQPDVPSSPEMDNNANEVEDDTATDIGEISTDESASNKSLIFNNASDLNRSNLPSVPENNMQSSDLELQSADVSEKVLHVAQGGNDSNIISTTVTEGGDDEVLGAEAQNVEAGAQIRSNQVCIIRSLLSFHCSSYIIII